MHRGLVAAKDAGAVERHLVDEAHKGILDVGKIAIGVQVLEVDIGDDRQRRQKLEKGAVALVSLGDQVFPAS